jgi:uncharacterized protein (TIGR01777 family)
MKIVLTGGSGFLGRHLSRYFLALGHEIVLIQRSDIKDGANRISKLIKSTDVLINLAGSPVIKRWTTANKAEMLSSRLNTTNILVDALKRLEASERPSVFLSASAIGIYDSNKVHTEQSVDFDDNFLSELCIQWEMCLDPLIELNIRLCVIRIGIVLGNDGGMMKRLKPIFKAGLGGKIGTGTQGFSFIHYHDFCKAVGYLAENSKCRGIFNLTAPEFSTNANFTRILARECHRPAFFTIPETGLKLIYGKAAVAMLKGQSVYPQHLLDCGFEFQYPNVGSAIHALLSQ